MNKLFSLAALLMLPAFAWSIGVYNPGDELYVLAEKGLVLRKTGDLKGERILTLNTGDAVTVQKTDFKKKPFTAEEFKGFNIKGFWVKVRTADGKEGYVFDGYLSKYKAPTRVADDTNSGYSTAELFLIRNSEKKGDKIVLPKTDTRYERYRQLFKNGSEAEIDNGEGGNSQKITFQKGITMEEAYLIGKGLWLKGMKVKSVIAKGKITVTSDDELWAIEVSNRSGITTLLMQHAD